MNLSAGFLTKEEQEIQKIEKKVLRKKVNPLYLLVFGLLFVIFIGSLFLYLPFTHKENIHIKYLDALFTATSASTVTGLVTLDTANTYNFFGQLVILILINIGGLGYMSVITFFLLSSHSLGIKYAVFMKESLNLPSMGDIFKVAKKVFLTIIVFEIIGIVILSLAFSSAGNPVWNGIFHAMSAFNNAGFDLMGNFGSLTHYDTNWIVNLTIMGLIFFGGIGFIVISDLLQVMRGHKKGLSLHSKIALTTSLVLILIGAVGFYVFESANLLKDYPVHDRLLISFFQSVSSRTAGYNTVDLSNLSTPASIIMSCLMFIGASPGSTGSGIKTTTFAILVLWLVCTIKNRENPEAFKKRISNESLNKAFVLFFSSIITVVGIIFLVSIFDNFEMKKVIFECFSAFGTVGLTMGITPYLSGASKICILTLMFIGRLTPLALIAILTRKKRERIKYLEEPVSVG
jgi:trk system potassium uptake protein